LLPMNLLSVSVFLGLPIDVVVFDGLSDVELREIVFIEVKTEASATLSTRERRVRDAVLERRVGWRKLRVNAPGPAS